MESETGLEEIKQKVKASLQKLYEKDAILFERNNSKGLCERCLVFRFGLYLQEEFSGYFVDCDCNSASVNGQDVNGKPIPNPDGRTSTNRFVDIIIHRRTFRTGNDFICFEVKKWNNSHASEKDKNNLRVLTSGFGYKYGFYLILGRRKEKIKWIIFQHGEPLSEMGPVFL